MWPEYPGGLFQRYRYEAEHTSPLPSDRFPGSAVAVYVLFAVCSGFLLLPVCVLAFVIHYLVWLAKRPKGKHHVY